MGQRRVTNPSEARADELGASPASTGQQPRRAMPSPPALFISRVDNSARSPPASASGPGELSAFTSPISPDSPLPSPSKESFHPHYPPGSSALLRQHEAPAVANTTAFMHKANARPPTSAEQAARQPPALRAPVPINGRRIVSLTEDSFEEANFESAASSNMLGLNIWSGSAPGTTVSRDLAPPEMGRSGSASSISSFSTDEHWRSPLSSPGSTALGASPTLTSAPLSPRSQYAMFKDTRPAHDSADAAEHREYTDAHADVEQLGRPPSESPSKSRKRRRSKPAELYLSDWLLRAKQPSPASAAMSPQTPGYKALALALPRRARLARVFSRRSLAALGVVALLVLYLLRTRRPQAVLAVAPTRSPSAPHRAATRDHQNVAAVVQDRTLSEESAEGSLSRAEVLAQEKIKATARAKERKKKKAGAKGGAKVSTSSNLLGIDTVPRRYLYGANFQPALMAKAIADAESDEENGSDAARENTNKLVDELPTHEEREQSFLLEQSRYLRERSDWETFVWTPPPAHESLVNFAARLNDEELEMRDWIKRFRMSTEPPSHGVGLGAATSVFSSDEISNEDHKPWTADDTDAGEQRADDARRRRARSEQRRALAETDTREFFGGDLSKWVALMSESSEELGGSCAGATWLQTYKDMHEDMLAERREPAVISYSCERGMNCGGLGDRLLAMTSAFFISLVTKRVFLAEWQTPIPLDVVFDSPFIDWSFSSFTSDSHPLLGNDTFKESARDLDIIHFDRKALDKTFGTKAWRHSKPGDRLTKGMEKRDLAWDSPWIKFFSNRGMVYRSFSYTHLQKRIHQLGLKPLSAFSCILNYLFRPKPPSLDFITDYTSVLSLPTVLSIGIQIRTGDASMKDPEYDQSNTVELHNRFFKCANQLAETYSLPDQKVVYYLVTDSAHLRQDAIEKLGDKVVVSGAGIEHIHVKSGHADGVFSAVLEDWILAKTDYRVITQDSGFGKIATFASGQRASTITLFPENNLDVVGLKSKKSHIDVDCRLDSAFSTFDELSNEWSLG